MKSNNKYFSKEWTKVLIIMLPLLLPFILLFINSSKKINVLLFVLLFVLIFIIGPIFLVRKYAIYKVKKLFQNPDSKPLIEYYNKIFEKNTLMNNSDKEVMLNFSKSIVHCYYSEFDKVEEIIRNIEWSNKLPYLQACEFRMKALISFFRDKNYEEGLRLFVKASEKSEIAGVFPGSRTVKESDKLFIEIGKALTGDDREEMVNILQGRFKRTRYLNKELLAWCLAIVYKGLNNKEKSDFMINYNKRSMPYCNVLHNI